MKCKKCHETIYDKTFCGNGKTNDKKLKGR
jgi:hypothetical protein